MSVGYVAHKCVCVYVMLHIWVGHKCVLMCNITHTHCAYLRRVSLHQKKKSIFFSWDMTPTQHDSHTLCVSATWLSHMFLCGMYDSVRGIRDSFTCTWLLYMYVTHLRERLHSYTSLSQINIIIKRRYSAKETYILLEPTNRGHPIAVTRHMPCIWVVSHMCGTQEWVTHIYAAHMTQLCLRLDSYTNLQYGVATISRLLKIHVCFAKAPYKGTIFCKRDVYFEGAYQW